MSTKIEWTDKTWNPITGCTKYSQGCLHCYAETMSRRLRGMGVEKYRNEFALTLHEESLEEPLRWRKPHNIFVCSMSDLFHKDVPYEFIDRVFEIIKQTPQHRYQVLTKRAERMAEYFSLHEVPNNVWLGVTVENAKYKYRIDLLREIPATIHFLSCEPLLGSLGNLNLSNIEWVIVGGESGASARPMSEAWVLEIKEQVVAQGSAFFFKQWGTWGRDGIKRSKYANGKLLQGKVIQEMPLIKELQLV
nr:phage Gp37/Gp68 family protein [uncultured Porphyromonas sp.]